MHFILSVRVKEQKLKPTEENFYAMGFYPVIFKRRILYFIGWEDVYLFQRMSPSGMKMKLFYITNYFND